MRPYYEQDGIVIYHGDCREVLPTLDVADLVLTDPPYGINADQRPTNPKKSHGWRSYGSSNWDSERPDAEVFARVLAAGRDQIVWGGNYFADLFPPSQCWLCWDKGQRDFSLADFELAWTSFDRASRSVTVSRGRAVQDGKVHPTQKSLGVIEWCFTAIADKYAPTPPKTIVDPFMGSGTTLVAAKRLGRTAVGIELDERYCERAAHRLRQRVLDLFGD